MALLKEKSLDEYSFEESEERQRIRAELDEKLARLYELMMKTKKHPIHRGHEYGAPARFSADCVSGIVQYPISSTPTTGEAHGTTKYLKTWLRTRDYSANSKVAPSPKTKNLETETTTLYSMVELMSQAVINDNETGDTRLLGVPKIRARAMPPEDPASQRLQIEGLSNNEFALHDLELQLALVSDALETVELIATAQPPRPYHRIGTLIASMTLEQQ